MNPALLLRQQLAPPAAPVIGDIIAVEGAIARVQTARGIVECRIVGSEQYRAGEGVLIRGGVVVARVAAAAAVKRYRV
jgi:hypothetical protein